jgi:RHS repeat-associated protein
MTSSDQHATSGGSDTTTTNTYGGSSGGPDALTASAASGGSTSTSAFGYDAAGNMTSSSTPANGTQSMTWTADGKLATVTGTGGTTSYVYDADGNLLLQEDPGTATLYLPGEQLTATTGNSTTTVTGARIIPLPSGGDVVRTGATTSYYFEIPDQQGTNDLYLDNTAQNPTWRQYTPYGAPRGTTTTWVDNRGFLNRPADAATGLDYLGARAYNPATGQFISPDPVLNPADPQDLNPYDYAEDNPVASEDPTGQMPVYDTPDGSYSGYAPSAENVFNAQLAGNATAPYAPTYTPQAPVWTAGPTSASAPASAPYMAITSHVIVQASDSYYKSMTTAPQLPRPVPRLRVTC